MRLIMMGHQVLAEGFALLGFETFPEATLDDVEQVLSSLLKSKEKAFVLLETHLTYQTSTSGEHQPLPALSQARREAARIVIAEIPPLQTPETYHPTIETLVSRVLGSHVLDKTV